MQMSQKYIYEWPNIKKEENCNSGNIIEKIYWTEYYQL